MNKLEIQSILAMTPLEAAAIIKEKFRAKQTFETNRPKDTDKYFFLVDPTITIPSSVLEVLPEESAFDTAAVMLWLVVGQFAQDLVAANEWGVVGSHIPRNREVGGFLHLIVQPGYLERGGRIRQGVDPRVIPGFLVTLMAVKERLAVTVKTLVDAMATPGWWREMGYLNADRRKQDWSPRED